MGDGGWGMGKRLVIVIDSWLERQRQREYKQAILSFILSRVLDREVI